MLSHIVGLLVILIIVVVAVYYILESYSELDEKMKHGISIGVGCIGFILGVKYIMNSNAKQYCDNLSVSLQEELKNKTLEVENLTTEKEECNNTKDGLLTSIDSFIVDQNKFRPEPEVENKVEELIDNELSS